MKKAITQNRSEQAGRESVLPESNVLIGEDDAHGSKHHNRESTKRSSKKLTGSLAAKIVAICLVVVSAVMCVASAAAVIMADYMNVYSEDEAAVLAHWNERLLDRYSVYALVNGINQNGELIKDTKVREELDQTNFRYGIFRTDDFSSVDLNDKKSYLMENLDKTITLNDVNLYSCNWNAYTAWNYDMSLFGYAYVNNYAEDTCESQQVDAYFYDWMNETLYIKVGERLYPYSGEILVKLDTDREHTFYVPSDEAQNEQVSEDEVPVDSASETTEYEAAGVATEEAVEGIVGQVNEEAYDGEDMANPVDTGDYIETPSQQPLNNAFLNESLTDWRVPTMLLVLSNSGQYLRAEDVVVVDDQVLQGMGEISDYSVDDVSAGMAVVPAQRMNAHDSYYVVSYVNEPLDVKADFRDCDLFAQAKLLVDFAFAYKYVFVLLLVLSLIAGIAAFVFLLCAAGHRNGVEGLCRRPWDAIPVDVNIGGVLCIDVLLFVAAIYVGEEWNPFRYLVFWLFAAGVGVIGILLLIECSMSFALWCKLGQWWKHTLIYAVAKFCWKGLKFIGRMGLRVWNRLVELLHSMRFLWKAWLILGAIACMELLAIVVCGYESPVVLFIFWLIEKLILYPVIVFALLQMNRLQEGSKTLAQGDLMSKIDTSKMYWEFKKHGDNLNAIGDGMNAAVSERMKSERFKTELITNVSHDIKTPLTSIINYVDLLGKEQIDHPKAAEYLDVLSRQSARLKKLIEDLIEASKASTGNLKVVMEVCDAQVTLVQTIGEYEEKLAQGQIELQIREPEEQIKIQADSRHLWRVFDNLMNNICKYAQPGTRAYVNLEQEGDRAVITFRNISREPLNITSEELMERFVRGDSSRSMEGNGLGLSIARSLTELMGGTLELTVDGDLFKVVLLFPVIND
ncbi:MAG: HAMP domain-containing histidine kinase [Lachnospiraceae bacterium]|nr:HAMP domain-containing histidine kinase [Lachnospiraceae bacterium]